MKTLKGINDQLDCYFEKQKEMFEYFGYEEGWVVIPMDDNREMYWFLTGEGHGDEVWYTPDKETAEVLSKNGCNYDDPRCKSDQVYSSEIYTQRFLPKWVYRGAELTMVCVDTHTEGNKFLFIFDNKKEVVYENT